MHDDAYKRAKEAFVADLHGTSAYEVLLVFSIMPVGRCRSLAALSIEQRSDAVLVAHAGYALAVLGAHAAARGRGRSPHWRRQFRTYMS